MMLIRELAIGLMLSFAAAIVVGAVMTAGSVIGGSMELNSGAILRADVESPNILSDGFGALAALLFFVGGFHRMLIAALAHSLSVFPLGALPLPEPHTMIALGGRMFALALGLAFPVMVPLFVLSIAQGVIARLAPQVNILTAAPAAIVTAGLVLLALDASGLRHRHDADLDQCDDAIDGMAQWLIATKRFSRRCRRSANAPARKDTSRVRAISPPRFRSWPRSCFSPAPPRSRPVTYWACFARRLRLPDLPTSPSRWVGRWRGHS